MLLRYRWFFLSCLAAFTGGHLLNYAVVIYAQEAIGSDWLSGVGYGLCFGPPLLLGWLAGVLCDRHAPGRLIHAAQAGFMLAALLLWAAHSLAGSASARVVLLLAAALTIGVAWSFASPARMAALGQVVAPGDLQAASVAFNLLVMLGFGLAPVVIALLRRSWQWAGVFGGAAVLAALASVLLLAVPTRASGRAHAPVRDELREGLAAVRERPLLAQLMLCAMAGYLAMGPMAVLLPKLALARLGLTEMQRGAFLGALALALIGGGVLAMVLARRVRHGPVILGGSAAAGLALTALGAAHSAGIAVALLVGVGLAGGCALSLIVAGIQAQAPPALRGRIVSMYTVTSQVVPAASGVLAGAWVHAWGVGVALHLCGGALVLLMMLAVWRMRALRIHTG